ncbi:heparan-alpha-glucosaminide N-acetyltransferase domain-containing protein [Nocardioides piscis]|uniref:DUF1624 domain-containing protein n=1 Tax=Nocardioides piscis TaxID=2714938 RepID=A0A6G7YGP3_9ACTN|nr:heparan-alpha-glucosaminide N-acetyltransferase domain-containing protein [Nocardioides piscis]QIK75985.1 DUF1624 domain-containing protein [Nocardioides piscis]
MVAPVEDSPQHRLRGVDATRGVAVLSMYVAHFSTGEGVLKALEVSEYLTAALFSTVIGVGAELARSSPHRDGPRDLVSVVVRAAALVLLGLWLVTFGSQILVVLVWLGVLTLVMYPLVRLPSVLLVAVAGAAFAVGPVVRADLLGAAVPRAWLVDLTFTHPAYWLVGFLVHALTGVLAVRMVRHPRGRGLAPWAALLSVVVAVGLLAAITLDDVDVPAYSGTHLELLLTTCLCLATLALVSWAAHTLPPKLTLPLVWVGEMALTLYVLQIVFSAWVVGIRPTDNGVDVMVAAVLASLLIVLAWRAVVRLVANDVRSGWRRGPLEGLVAAVITLLDRLRGTMAGPIRRTSESAT